MDRAGPTDRQSMVRIAKRANAVDDLTAYPSILINVGPSQKIKVTLRINLLAS
jgi:hypothetical protein